MNLMKRFIVISLKFNISLQVEHFPELAIVSFLIFFGHQPSPITLSLYEAKEHQILSGTTASLMITAK